MKRKLMMLGMLAAALPALTQEQKTLSLNEAVALSLKNSKQLRIGDARVQAAAASLKEAEQRRLPDGSVTGGYMRLAEANVDIKRQSSSSGGTSGGAPSVNQAMYGILNVGLPIYTGGKIRYGIESARYLAEAAKLDAATDRAAVIENTVEAYVNLYKARAAVNLVKENLSQAEQRLKDLRNLEKNGLLARNDLLKAEVQASNTELTLLDVENNWQLANVNMNLLLGLPEKTALQPDSAFLQTGGTLQALDDYVQGALHGGRNELASLELKGKAAQTGVKVAKADYLPNLQLTGGYIAAHIPNMLTITNAANIGLGVSYNLGSLWKTRAKVEGAEARAREAAASQDLVADQVRLQVNRYYLNYLSSRKKIEVNAKAVEQASENYRIIKNKAANSLATTTEVLEADVAQLQAGLNYAFAKADAVVAYHQLLQSAGQLESIIK